MRRSTRARWHSGSRQGRIALVEKAEVLHLGHVATLGRFVLNSQIVLPLFDSHLRKSGRCMVLVPECGVHVKQRHVIKRKSFVYSAHGEKADLTLSLLASS